ncbi:MAG: hypothetical protein GF383_04605 [Candidatus Lokiarchaeota archaeon]|nr:hypothetical protein [Candidatus Lokiarchaeota archaeon]MBD3339066.1 hypothetical protein [Candidatus Lokiarchaeota archaeon]
MKSGDFILALFFSDENSCVYEKLKVAGNIKENLEEKNIEDLKTLSLRFLGPLFIAASIKKETNWKIEFIEASLSQYQGRTIDPDLLQSIFALNSSIDSDFGLTNLFSIIASPYTEDLKLLHDIIDSYIHPSIIQERIVNESILGSGFKFNEFIYDELKRGANLLNSFLGSARRMYWEEQQKYYCIGVIERIRYQDQNKEENYLYTFDKEESIRSKIRSYIPSYYIISILPNYYENRISETLKLFDKTSVYPNIRMIKMSDDQNKVVYLEENLTDNELKKRYGVILVSEQDFLDETEKLSFFKQKLRTMVESDEEIERNIVSINPKINPFIKWNINTESGLDQIKLSLDEMN